MRSWNIWEMVKASTADTLLWRAANLYPKDSPEYRELVIFLHGFLERMIRRHRERQYRRTHEEG